MGKLLEDDKKKYPKGKMPKFQYFFRQAQESTGLKRKMYHFLLVHYRKKNCVDISPELKIGGGWYCGHPYAITINSHAVLGRNVSVHKGVTIGRENRGRRKGFPVIGDNVWIGINATVVGNVHIGNDVLIAPNTFVNQDIPDHSVVFGNPCIIKHRENATEGYINIVV